MPDPSPPNAESLNSNFLQPGRRSGGRPQRTVYPRRLPVKTVIHTTLAGVEPTTFGLLVRRATSRASLPVIFDSPSVPLRMSQRTDVLYLLHLGRRFKIANKNLEDLLTELYAFPLPH